MPYVTSTNPGCLAIPMMPSLFDIERVLLLSGKLRAILPTSWLDLGEWEQVTCDRLTASMRTGRNHLALLKTGQTGPFFTGVDNYFCTEQFGSYPEESH